MLAVLFRRRAQRPQPLAMAWTLRRKQTRWAVVQSLGPDSLGGYGGGGFETAPDHSVQLVARTYRTPAGFSECATCPHVFALRRFDLGPQGFSGAGTDSVASTYSTFVAFIQAIAAGRTDDAQNHVVDSVAAGRGGAPRVAAFGGAWRTAPGADETPYRLVFYRGQREAYAVRRATRDVVADRRVRAGGTRLE